MITAENAPLPVASDRLVHELRRKRNVRIECASEIVGVHGNGRLREIDVANRETGITTRRASDAVFVFAGGDARIEWLPRAVACNERGYILTGFHMLLTTPELWPLQREPFLLETSVPGIFAAGDIGVA